LGRKEPEGRPKDQLLRHAPRRAYDSPTTDAFSLYYKIQNTGQDNTSTPLARINSFQTHLTHQSTHTLFVDYQVHLVEYLFDHTIDTDKRMFCELAVNKVPHRKIDAAGPVPVIQLLTRYIQQIALMTDA